MHGRMAVVAGLLAVGATGAAAVPARASGEAIRIRGVNVEQTIACDGRDVVIQGTSHRLHLSGRCPHVSVQGTAHVVWVETLGRATVSGMNNRVEWERAMQGERPGASVTGVGNRVVRASGGDSGTVSGVDVDESDDSVTIRGRDGAVVVGPGGVSVHGRGGTVVVDDRTGGVSVGSATGSVSLTVSENDLTKAYDCDGGNALVEGSENRLTLSDCRELTVTGAENHVVLLGPVRRIRLLGGDNSVEWSEGAGGRPPAIETPGGGNRVTRKPR